MIFNPKKYSESHFTNVELITGVAAGVILGVAAGLLLAPRSGKKMRKLILNTFLDQSDELVSQWSKAKKQARKAAKEVRSNIDHMADNAKDRYDDVVSNTRHKAEELADRVDTGVKKAQNSLHNY